jgi:hypothetical protein
VTYAAAIVSDWIEDLERVAPDVVAAWRGIEAEQFLSVRREVRRRAGAGSAGAMVTQLAATALALTEVVRRLPAEALELPGGEADWTVAEAIGHDAAARVGLVMAAGLASSGRWPTEAPTVVPSVAGPARATREELIRKLEQSQRIVARSARQVEGHETDPCLLDHPLVGRLRCGEWLLFAGVHDVMHLEQLHGIAASLARTATLSEPSEAGSVG